MAMKQAAAAVIVIVAILCTVAVLPAFAQTSDYWSPKASMPYPISNASGSSCAAVLNGEIYTVAEYQNLYVYDPITDTWLGGIPVPGIGNALLYFTVAACENKIYVIGVAETAGPAAAEVWVNEAYDPTTNTWENKTPLASPRVDWHANVVNGEIYIISGGQTVGFEAETAISTTDVYNPATALLVPDGAHPNPSFFLRIHRDG